MVVSTGVDSPFEYGMQALNHGKNVLIEKPMTRTYQEAKMLFDTAKRKGLFVQCYQNRRFDADYLTTLKVIESGTLGEIYEVDMHFDYYRPEVPQNAMHTLSLIHIYPAQSDLPEWQFHLPAARNSG